MKLDLWGEPVRRRPPYSGSLALVHVPTDRCPACGGEVEDETVEAAALFRHGGYGATLRTVRRVCGSCGWASTVEVSEARPT